MSNGITERQNEDKYICHLGAQRQLYNEAKRFDNVELLFSVGIPLILAIIQIAISDNIYLNTVSYLMSIVSMALSIWISSFVKQTREKAAEIQQHFDTYVYQMPWDKKLFGQKNDVTHIVAEKSKLLFKQGGEREKLKNWYTIVVENVNLEKGILMCQKENYNWDVGLRRRFRCMSSIIIGILVAGIFLIGIVKNESVPMLICRFAFITPMLQWLAQTIKQLNKDIKNLEELDELLAPSESKSMDDLQEIQWKIYMHRKSCFMIPNWFYRKYKDNDEDVAHRTALMNQ